MPGTSLDATTAEFLAEGGVGIILFAKNLSSADQVRRLTSEIACAGSGRVIVAVDQEPGRVARLEPVGVETPSIQAEEEIFREQARALGRAMALIGVNLDLAPVVDVVRGDNPVLVGRNFGPDAAVVAKRGVDFILALEESGVGTTAKHFPGHGLSTVDPHLVVTPISASLAELEEHDFLPFHAAIKAGVAAVMVGHPIYAALDLENPASLSPAVLTLLREEFGFEGVAMTDAFSMAGVRAGGSVSVLAQQAIAAGEDMLIVDNPAEVSGVVAALETAVEEGLLDRARLAEAAGRVRRLAASLVEIPCDA
jgi:beta-N-acetylhexosaminidase